VLDIVGSNEVDARARTHAHAHGHPRPKKAPGKKPGGKKTRKKPAPEKIIIITIPKGYDCECADSVN